MTCLATLVEDADNEHNGRFVCVRARLCPRVNWDVNALYLSEPIIIVGGWL